MIKEIYFDRMREEWPEPSVLEPFFLAPPGREFSYYGGNDSWGLKVQGLYGTENLKPYEDRVDVDLGMWGNPQHGVMLFYHKYGGGYSEAYYSKGNLARIVEWIRTRHGDRHPIGLYIPFRRAWPAIKEFMETEGSLPKSIDWIAGRDLPAQAFPGPTFYYEQKY